MAVTLMFNISCNNNKSSNDKNTADVNEVIVKEVLQANSYTYLLVEENGEEKWIAGPKMVASVGATYYYNGALEMTNFESKDLNRVFDKVYFVESVTETAVAKEKVVSPHMMESPHASGKKIILKQEGISLTLPEGVTAIENVYAQVNNLNGKVIKVQGIVVKINKEIMDHDWIHIQDGTGSGNDSDLTITTKNSNLNLGDTVVCIGKLIQDKDFGHGYKYDAIIEDGVFEVLK